MLARFVLVRYRCGMTPHAIHAAAAAAQLLLSLFACGCCAWLATRVRRLETALDAQRRLTGRTRTPALTQVLPSVHAPKGPLPRFRLTHFDHGNDSDAPQSPPPLPF